MLDRTPRGIFRPLRPAFLTLATVGLVWVGQLDGFVPTPVRASVIEPAPWTLAAAALDLPELSYRPARQTTAEVAPADVAPAAAPPIESVETTAPLPVVSAQPAPVRRAVPTAAPTAAPSAAPATVPPAAATCPADWICYPRVGIAGPIVPYTDCSGGSDVGTAIRAFVCLSPTYLLGHAYTQFGKITAWRAGDVVYAYGKLFTVTGATTQSSCAPPTLPLAPLSLQTSLSPSACGPVLVVQAR